MRLRPAPLGSLTSLGFIPILFVLLVTNWLHIELASLPMTALVLSGTPVFANTQANTGLLALLALTYTAWILGVARGWITTATGGGLVIAAYALSLRIIVEVPQALVQLPMATVLPPEPYATVLPLGRALGLAAYVGGLAFVLAAVLSERRLRREGPAWATPP